MSWGLLGLGVGGGGGWRAKPISGDGLIKHDISKAKYVLLDCVGL